MPSWMRAVSRWLKLERHWFPSDEQVHIANQQAALRKAIAEREARIEMLRARVRAVVRET